MENNYKTIKLEKDMYKNPNKSFSETLEELDPSENYQNTPLRHLDAFQRQLKRFDIQVKGKNSDTVSKFFQTSDSQALFPEYVSRSINAGIEEEYNVKNLVANTIKIDSLQYKNISISTGEEENKKNEVKEIKEGDQIPEVKISLKENAIKLKKIGSMLTCSYETLQFQKIAAFNIALKQIGKNFNNIIFKDAIKTLIDGDGNENPAPKISIKQKLSYASLLEIWAKLKPYNMTTIIINPAFFKKMLTIPEFLNPQTGLNFQKTGTFSTAMGAKIITSTSLPETTVIALDKNYALNQIISQYLKIESDKIIDKQLNKSVITMRYGFAKIFKEASINVTLEG